MIFSLFKRKKANEAVVSRQYGALTEAARAPALYTHMNVPDTVMGRFEMLCIHMVLYFRRTRGAGEAAERLAQEIVDAFFEDMDHSIRELGVGDMGVPKRMKKLARMFYGRGKTYGEALDRADREALARALERNIFPETSGKPEMGQVADYMLLAETSLKQAADELAAAGGLTFPLASGGARDLEASGS